MDLASLGVDAGIVIGIVALTQVITGLIKNRDKWERWFPLIPIALGLVAAVSMAMTGNTFDIAIFIQRALAYAGVASLVYKTGKTTIMGA